MDETREARAWRSRIVTDGLERAPHRAFLRAMGLSDEDIARPFISVLFLPRLSG
ncbi:MAG: hypothetical protein ACT4P2_08420 [Pseudomonadota bacterium]